MANFKAEDRKITFFVNGGDKTSSAIIISLILGITGVIFISMIYIISIKGSFIVFLMLLIFNFLSISIVYYMGLSGVFARYKVIFEKNTVKAYDIRENKIIFEEIFNEEKLYVSETLMNFGYVVRKIKALVYGSERIAFIRDAVPSHQKILLCFGKLNRIEALKNKIINIARL